MCRKTAFLFWILFLAFALVQAAVKGPYSIQSLNYPDYRIGVSAISDQSPAAITQNGRRFLIQSPGLTANPGTVSLEASDWPNTYLSHHDSFLSLRSRQSTSDNSATFQVVEDTGNRGYIRFESVDQPGSFIRHANYKLRLQKDDGSQLFKKDSSFRYVEGPYLLQSENFRERVIGIAQDTNAVLSNVDKGEQFNFVHPGLTGLNGTLSLESQNKVNHYLRHYGYLVDLEDKDHPRNPAMFDADASFKICQDDCFVEGFVSLEAVNMADYYLRHSQSRVKMDLIENSDVFKGDASYRRILAPFYQESYNYPGYRLDVGESALAFTEQGQRFLMVFPGLGRKPGTVSIEAVDNGGHYLMEETDGRIKLTDGVGMDQESFKQQASFYIRESPWFGGTFALESTSSSGLFMKREGKEIKFITFTDNNDFKSSASYIRSTKDPLGDVMEISHSLIQSFNFPNFTIGFTFGSEDAYMLNSGKRFLIQTPGLNGKPGTISFHSTDRPDAYIRHYASLLSVESRINPRNPGLFLDDATFYLREDLWYQGWHAIESFSVKNGFIRHSGYRLVVTLNDGTELFKQDASFRRIEGPYFLQSYNYPNFRLGINSEKHAVLDRQGHAWYLVHPGLNLNNQSVSLESAWQLGSYLRHYSYTVDLEDGENPRNEPIFRPDSTYMLRMGKFFENFWALESVNLEDHYLRHEGSRFKMATGQGDLFSKDASYRFVQGMFILESFNYRGYGMSTDNTGKMFIGRGGVRIQLIIPGLSGQQGTVSLELVTSPGTYITHQEAKLTTIRIEGATNRADASWWLREEMYYKNTLCLESVSQPGFFVRHKNYELVLSKMEDSSLFKHDASFYRVAELRAPDSFLTEGPYSLQEFESPNRFIAIEASTDTTAPRNAFMTSDQGHRFFIQTPGLNNQSNTVSFVSADRPNHYLRHHSYKLRVESIEGAANPHIFDLDSTFIPLHMEDKLDALMFESINLLGYYISAVNDELKLVKNGEQRNVRNFASFRYVEGPYYLESFVEPNQRLSPIEKKSINSEAKLSPAGRKIYFGFPGVSGRPESLSVWLAEDPNLLLCVLNHGSTKYEQFLILDEVKAEEERREECTFRKNSAVNGATPGFFALESVTYGNDYLAVSKSQEIVIERGYSVGHVPSSSAGFRFIKGPAVIRAYNMRELGLTVGSLPDQQVSISENTTEFLMVYPGLCGQPGTVSFQVRYNRTQYLRHHGYLIDAKGPRNAKNDNNFADDASFYVREHYWNKDTMAFELVNLAGHFLRHSGFQIKVAEDDNTKLFQEDASFFIEVIDVPEPDGQEDEVESLSVGGRIGVAIGTFLGGVLFMVLLIISDRIAAKCCHHRTLVRREGRYDTNDGFDNPTYLSDVFSSDMTMMYTPEGGVKFLDNKDEPIKGLSRDSSKLNFLPDKEEDQVDGAISNGRKKQEKSMVTNPLYSYQVPQPSLATQLSVDLFVDAGQLSDFDAMAGSGLPEMSNTDLLEDLKKREVLGEINESTEASSIVPMFNIGPVSLEVTGGVEPDQEQGENCPESNGVGAGRVPQGHQGPVL